MNDVLTQLAKGRRCSTSEHARQDPPARMDDVMADPRAAKNPPSPQRPAGEDRTAELNLESVGEAEHHDVARDGR